MKTIYSSEIEREIKYHISKLEDIIDSCVVIEKAHTKDFWKVMSNQEWYQWDWIDDEQIELLEKYFPDDNLLNRLEKDDSNDLTYLDDGAIL